MVSWAISSASCALPHTLRAKAKALVVSDSSALSIPSCVSGLQLVQRMFNPSVHVSRPNCSTDKASEHCGRCPHHGIFVPKHEGLLPPASIAPAAERANRRAQAGQFGAVNQEYTVSTGDFCAMPTRWGRFYRHLRWRCRLSLRSPRKTSEWPQLRFQPASADQSGG